MINFIAEILGALIRLIYNLVGQNYGLSIVIFTVITKIILFPITYKQSKAMDDMSKLAPLEKEIREKYKGNKEKQSEELMKVYSEHKVNPMGGCLPLLIQIPIIFAMFYIVKQPLTYILQVPTEELTAYTQEYLGKEEVTEKEVKAYEIQVADKNDLLNMKFAGFDFGDVPSNAFSKESEEKASYLSLIVPVLSLAFSILQIKQSQKNSTLTEEQMEQQKTMNLMMPLLTAFIAYTMPLALGIYWLLGNVLQIISQAIINKMIKNKKKMIGGETK